MGGDPLVRGAVWMRTRKLSTQILTSQVTILVVTVLVGFGLFAHEEAIQLDNQYQQMALAIAQTTAGVPEIRNAMEYGGGGDVVQTISERIRKNSGARYVVVIDRDGIRHSHPNLALIGQPLQGPGSAPARHP